MWRQLGQRSQDGSKRQVRECLCGPVRAWLLAPVRERMGGECPCPSTGTPWAASRTLQPWRGDFFLTCWCGSFRRVGSSRHSRRSLWRGCGCIRSSLAAVPTCSASRSVRRPPVGGLHRPCSHEALLTTLTTRRFSWRTTGSALASPCLLSLRFCRQPERGAVLQRQQRVPHGLLQCDEPSLHRAHPRLVQEGTARSAVPPDRARGVWRCRLC